MTDEEILAAVKQHYQTIEPDTDLHNCIRELVVRTAEEALHYSSHQYDCASLHKLRFQTERIPCDCGLVELERRIRAMKGSLAAEAVS